MILTRHRVMVTFRCEIAPMINQLISGNAVQHGPEGDFRLVVTGLYATPFQVSSDGLKASRTAIEPEAGSARGLYQLPGFPGRRGLVVPYSSL